MTKHQRRRATVNLSLFRGSKDRHQIDTCVFRVQLQAESIQQQQQQQQQGLFVKLSALLLLLLLLHRFPKGRISASHPAVLAVYTHCNVNIAKQLLKKTSALQN